MKKYCEILDNRVNFIFTEKDSCYLNYINSNLEIKEITNKLTIQGLDIKINCYYDRLHDLYFSSEAEYKNFQDMILIYIEDLAFENKNRLIQLQKDINEIIKDNQQIREKNVLINDKIDSLAKLLIHLNEK